MYNLISFVSFKYMPTLFLGFGKSWATFAESCLMKLWHLRVLQMQISWYESSSCVLQELNPEIYLNVIVWHLGFSLKFTNICQVF